MEKKHSNIKIIKRNNCEFKCFSLNKNCNILVVHNEKNERIKER